jgi:hypothetical protein
MEFMDVVAGLNKLYAENNENLQKNRSQILINTTQTAKFGETIDKKLNPIFGEQNSLILTNIQLETDRNKLLNLISSANDDVAKAQSNYNSALKEVQELTIQENVNDAEAAIRKAELQTQISLLTEAQSRGKDVTLDLALAQAQLAEAEFELANDSDALTAAKNILTIAEQNLSIAIENQQLAIEKRNEQLVKDIELTDKAIKKNNDYKSSIDRINQSIAGSDFGRLVSQGLVSLSAGGNKSVDTPADTLGSQDNVVQSGAGGTGGTTNVEVYIGDEKIEEVVQKVNTRIQNQGKTFAVR